MDTHPTEFSESFPMNTNMTGFWMFFKNLCILVLRMEVASGSEGLDNNVRVCYSIQFIDSGFVFSAVVRCVFWAPVGCSRMTQMMRMMMSGSGPPGLLSVSIDHGLSQQGVWVSFWTPKPLKSTPQDTQILL